MSVIVTGESIAWEETCKGRKIKGKEGKRRKWENRREKKTRKLKGKRKGQRVPWGSIDIYKVSEGEGISVGT